MKFAILLLLSAVSAIKLKQVSVAQVSQESPEEEFAKFDTDGDGKVTLGEARKLVEEHLAMMAKEIGHNMSPEEQAAATDFMMNEFHHADANGDGVITLEEAM